MTTSVDALLAFLRASVTPFHATRELVGALETHGFEPLPAFDALREGQGYYTTRNDSGLVAFRVGSGPVEAGIRLVGAHTDSPNLSVKPQPVKVRQGTAQLAVDVYGGALLNPWFDRDLSLAGRVSYVDGQGELRHALVNFERPIAIIPSLAIHLDREANASRSVNPQRDILPLLQLAAQDCDFDFHALLARQLQEEHNLDEPVRVLDYELSFYDSQPAALVGLRNDFIASARLDNLLSCFCGLQALCQAPTTQWSFLVCNDHEEVGSVSTVGAQGPMLTDLLTNIAGDAQSLRKLRENSWMLSVDNAHAVHPNFSDKHDDNHGPILGAGPVIKINRNQRYATSGEGAARLKLLAEHCGVAVQSFVMRSDMACGSTIGPLTAAETGIATTDIGLPTLAMHSIRELAATSDPDQLIQLLGAFFDRKA